MEDNKIQRDRNGLGQFVEGNSGGKPGRKMRSKEQITKDKLETIKFSSQQQQILRRLYSKYMPYLESAMERMFEKNPAAFVSSMEKFYKYCQPTFSNVNVEGDITGEINIVVKHKKTEAEPNED